MTMRSRYLVQPILFLLFSAFAVVGQIRDSSIVYSEYELARKNAESNHKVLLLYFTSRYSVNSRLLEKEIFNDSEIDRRLRSDFVVAKLFVDQDAKNGKENSSLQAKLGSDMQPALYFISDKDEVIDSFLGYGKMDKRDLTNKVEKIGEYRNRK
jgi:thioredoxin-related protein